MEQPIKPRDNINQPSEKDEGQMKFTAVARKGFFLYLPPLLALIIYIAAAVGIAVRDSGTKTEVYEIAFYALTGFTLLSPAINIFFRKWWRNTGLYILSLVFFWIMLNPLLEPAKSRSGTGIGEGAIIFMLPMLLPFIALPVSGILRILIYQFQQSRERNQMVQESN